jgi:Amt family ammonium transporter
VDDSLDVFAVHGVGGMLGSLLLAVLAVPSLGGTNPNAGATSIHQLGVQALAVAAAVLWSAILSYVLARGIAFITRPRVTDQQEYEGLDLTAHGERAYDYT